MAGHSMQALCPDEILFKQLFYLLENVPIFCLIIPTVIWMISYAISARVTLTEGVQFCSDNSNKLANITSMLLLIYVPVCITLLIYAYTCYSYVQRDNRFKQMSSTKWHIKVGNLHLMIQIINIIFFSSQICLILMKIDGNPSLNYLASLWIAIVRITIHPLTYLLASKKFRQDCARRTLQTSSCCPRNFSSEEVNSHNAENIQIEDLNEIPQIPEILNVVQTSEE